MERNLYFYPAYFGYWVVLWILCITAPFLIYNDGKFIFQV